METTSITTFTEMQDLRITHSNLPEFGPLVSLSQFGGSMQFHFNMTTAQAREMAAALIEHADAALTCKCEAA